MTDILERLRTAASLAQALPACREAAAEIERLRGVAQGAVKPAGAFDVEYTVDAKGSIQLPEGAPFDGEPVLIKLPSGWCEAYWEDALVGQNQDGATYDGFCWVYMDGEGMADLDDVKSWARLPASPSLSSTARATPCDGADDLEHLDGMLDDRERGS